MNITKPITPLGRFLALFLAFFALAALGPAKAEDWPARPVTIVHPFSVGGLDFAVRNLAKALTEKFGQPFIVENKPGAGGGVGSNYVAKSAPDGYAILLTGIGPAILNQMMSKSVPYDTDKDFTPTVFFGELPQLIVSSPKLGFKKLSDLVDYGLANPGKLNIGHAGPGSMGQLISYLFLSRTGIKGTLIAYRGSGPIITDVLGGQIQAGAPVYIPPVKTVTVLAVASTERTPFLPDVPTAREGGVDLIAGTWFAFMAPTGTPQPIIDKLNVAINEWLATPDGKKTCTAAGLRPMGGSQQKVAQTMKEDRALWGPVIEKEHIRLD